MAVELVENNTRIKVTYLDKRIVFIKPVPWIRLDDLTLYLKELLMEFFEAKGHAATLLSKKGKTLPIINQIVEMLPIVGDEKLDLEQIEEIEDIIKIFFIGKYKILPNENTVEITADDSSYLCTINSIFFRLMVLEAHQEHQTKVQTKT